MEEINGKIGSKSVSSATLPFAPSWVVYKDFEEKFRANWKDAFRPFHESDVLMEANVISSNTLFNVKTEDNGDQRLKIDFWFMGT